MRDLKLPGDRVLRFRVSGVEVAPAIVFHHGTPGTLPPQALVRAVLARGLRLVSISRPGYGGSTRWTGRDVVDVVADTAAVLDEIGADRVAMLGWSGGGPHALACSARLPGVIGATILSGLAPFGAEGLEFTEGMDTGDRDEWTAASRGEAALRAHVSPLVGDMVLAPSPEADLTTLPPADRIALRGAFGEDLVAANRDALGSGIDGWVDDELAFTRPWGFDLGEVGVPVTIRHGGDDVNVPPTHGDWLAHHLPTATLQRRVGEGHLSIMNGDFAEIVGSFAELL